MPIIAKRAGGGTSSRVRRVARGGMLRRGGYGSAGGRPSAARSKGRTRFASCGRSKRRCPDNRPYIAQKRYTLSLHKKAGTSCGSGIVARPAVHGPGNSMGFDVENRYRGSGVAERPADREGRRDLLERHDADETPEGDDGARGVRLHARRRQRTRTKGPALVRAAMQTIRLGDIVDDAESSSILRLLALPLASPMDARICIFRNFKEISWQVSVLS